MKSTRTRIRDVLRDANVIRRFIYLVLLMELQLDESSAPRTCTDVSVGHPRGRRRDTIPHGRPVDRGDLTTSALLPAG